MSQTFFVNPDKQKMISNVNISRELKPFIVGIYAKDDKQKNKKSVVNKKSPIQTSNRNRLLNNERSTTRTPLTTARVEKHYVPSSYTRPLDCGISNVGNTSGDSKKIVKEKNSVTARAKGLWR